MSCNYFSLRSFKFCTHSSSFIINIFCLKSHIFSFNGNKYFFNSKLGFCSYDWYSMITTHKNISIQKLNIWIFSIIVHIYFSICMVFPLFPWFCGYSKNQVLLTVKTVNHTNPISWCIYAWCTYDCNRMGWENALIIVFVKWV